jgi:hypothetical protein
VVSSYFPFLGLSPAGLIAHLNSDRYCVDGDMSYATHWRDKVTVFFLKRWVYLIVSSIFWVLECLRIVPKGRCEAIYTMAMAVFAMRDGAKIGIFTPMHSKYSLAQFNPYYVRIVEFEAQFGLANTLSGAKLMSNIPDSLPGSLVVSC